MRKLVIYCFLSVLTISLVNAQGEGGNEQSKLNWQKSYTKAQKKSKSQGKELLVFFTGSDWCSPCKMLVEDFFETEKFKLIAEDNFVLYEADNPRNKDLITDSQRVDNEKLCAKYNVNSYPTIIIFNSNGKEIARKKSYNFLTRDPSYHFEFVEQVIE